MNKCSCVQGTLILESMFNILANKCSCVQGTLILESMFRYSGNPLICEDSDLLLCVDSLISFPTLAPVQMDHS